MAFGGSEVYRSKQRFPIFGSLVIDCLVTSPRGSTNVSGRGTSASVSSNVRSLFERALLNAKYKHSSDVGALNDFFFNSASGFSDTSVDVLDWYFEYPVGFDQRFSEFSRGGRSYVSVRGSDGRFRSVFRSVDRPLSGVPVLDGSRDVSVPPGFAVEDWSSGRVAVSRGSDGRFTSGVVRLD